MTSIADLTEQIAALETTLGGTAGMVSSFDAELGKLQGNLAYTEKEVGALANGFGNGLRRAFEGVVLDGTKLSDSLRSLAKSMADTVFNAALKPVTDQFGGLVTGLLGQGFAKGGAFVQGQVMPFARGGVGSTYNWAPKLYHDLMTAHAEGELPEARRLQSISIKMIDAIAATGYFGTAKALMARLGVPVGPARLPLANPTDEQIDALMIRLDELGFALWGANPVGIPQQKPTTA